MTENQNELEYRIQCENNEIKCRYSNTIINIIISPGHTHTQFHTKPLKLIIIHINLKS